MSPTQKMSYRNKPRCGSGTDSGQSSAAGFFSDLFTEVWEVFVMRFDEKLGKHTWITKCCETVGIRRNRESAARACC